MPDTPLGVAVDPSGAFIYVSGFYSPLIYKIDVAQAAIVATPRSARRRRASRYRRMGAHHRRRPRRDAISFWMPRASRPKPQSRSARIPLASPSMPRAGGSMRRMSRAMMFRSSTCDGKADRDGAGRQAALCRRAGEWPRLHQRPIWRNGLRFRSRNLEAARARAVGDYPEGLQASADGRTVYVVNWFSNDVLRHRRADAEGHGADAGRRRARAFGLFLRKTP